MRPLSSTSTAFSQPLISVRRRVKLLKPMPLWQGVPVEDLVEVEHFEVGFLQEARPERLRVDEPSTVVGEQQRRDQHLDQGEAGRATGRA